MSYAHVNGLSLHYEEHGDGGEPLIMLHGGFGTGASFGPVLDELAYEKVAPRVEDFPVLIDKVGDATRQDYDWTAEVAGIIAPVMLIYADADSVSPAHIAEFYALLGGGLKDAGWDGSARPAARLAIMPGQIHTDVLTAPGLAAAVSTFLDAAALG
jgi:pimeloyl-ACP methyl ester carboxylesterase